MEDNDKQVIDETIEETQEEVNEVEETTDEDYSNDTPTVEDYEELKKKLKTIEAQKEHWRKKAEIKPALKKTNETPQGLTREEAILYAKGYTDDEISLATKLSAINGVSILEATEDELFKSKVENRKREERSKKAQLSPSGSGSMIRSEKPQGEMTREEHEAYYKKVMGV